METFSTETNDYLSETFSGLNGSKQIMTGKVFEDCSFSECNFSEAEFVNCRFIDCQFSKCNLSLLKLNGSKLTDVVFEECKVIGVDWTTINWSIFAPGSPISFYKCILNDASFFGLSLNELVLDECKAHDVDFREGDFTEANFSYTDFQGSMFRNTNLSGSDFIEAINYNIDIYVNEIKSAKFSRYEALSLLDSLEIELVD